MLCRDVDFDTVIEIAHVYCLLLLLRYQAEVMLARS